MIRLFLIILILLSSAPAHALVIEFKQAAEVSGVSVTLADIADFDEDSDLSRALATQTVSQAPSPGQEIKLNTQSVIRHFDKNLSTKESLNWRGAKTIIITRSTVEISSAEILNIIDEYLQKKKTELPEVKIHFSPKDQPLPFTLPSGELSWQVIPSDPAIIGSSRFSIIFSVDGHVRKNMSVRGKLEVLAQVVVAASTIRKGTILGPKHLAIATQDISTVQAPCLDPRQIIGKKLTSSAKSGNAISLQHVEFPPLIKKGELVRIVVSRGSLFLSAFGIARGDGTVNQTIRVQNTGSNKIVFCRVAGPGVVEVTL